MATLKVTIADQNLSTVAQPFDSTDAASVVSAKHEAVKRAAKTQQEHLVINTEDDSIVFRSKDLAATGRISTGIKGNRGLPY